MTAPNFERRSIPTEYNGRLFRSKLEADYARVFDTLGVEWQYEQRGKYYGDVFYFPDFWLPRSRQIVEVKGVFEPNDCRKIQAVVRHATPRRHTGEWCPDIPIIACIPDGHFFGWVRTAEPIDDWYRFLTTGARTVELFACKACLGFWFCDPDESFVCQCCGAHDGDHHLSTMIPSPFPEFPNVHALHFLAPNV